MLDPGDVLAIYLGLTTAFRGTLDAGDRSATTPHRWGILVTGLCLAGLLSLLGGLAGNLKETDAARRTQTREILGRGVLAVLAFGFWSVGVPGAWWEVKEWNEGVRVAIVFAISFVFALVAEIAVALLKKT